MSLCRKLVFQLMFQAVLHLLLVPKSGWISFLSWFRPNHVPSLINHLVIALVYPKKLSLFRDVRIKVASVSPHFFPLAMLTSSPPYRCWEPVCPHIPQALLSFYRAKLHECCNQYLATNSCTTLGEKKKKKPCQN